MDLPGHPHSARLPPPAEPTSSSCAAEPQKHRRIIDRDGNGCSPARKPMAGAHIELTRCKILEKPPGTWFAQSGVVNLSLRAMSFCRADSAHVAFWLLSTPREWNPRQDLRHDSAASRKRRDKMPRVERIITRTKLATDDSLCTQRAMHSTGQPWECDLSTQLGSCARTMERLESQFLHKGGPKATTNGKLDPCSTTSIGHAT